MTSNVKRLFFARAERLVIALLVLLFMYTGFNKLFGLHQFKATLYNQPIPHNLAAALAWIFPCLEIIAASCLLFGRTQYAGILLSLILLGIFTGYIGAILLHLFPKIPCSCGGIFRHLSWQQHFVVNLGLVGLTLFVLFRLRRPPTEKSPLNPSI
ncbi:MauE/DoxX family redox-associated membrane protein [Puia dinghuensis]|uniref:Methylamine utilisation protein MauE domain-containing protein n=1 Tax=Puia dinghuensis TaxID=1792502 RepID=A0A8J2UMV0_9BACT|nr:MauE/DoxX family redox-associated membrane protein [Puia dinghuensis]GGB26315.1 hypothetical protein GCM10011511_57840 [Puia dinghuensis]